MHRRCALCFINVVQLVLYVYFVAVFPYFPCVKVVASETIVVGSEPLAENRKTSRKLMNATLEADNKRQDDIDPNRWIRKIRRGLSFHQKNIHQKMLLRRRREDGIGFVDDVDDVEDMYGNQEFLARLSFVDIDHDHHQHGEDFLLHQHDNDGEGNGYDKFDDKFKSRNSRNRQMHNVEILEKLLELYKLESTSALTKRGDGPQLSIVNPLDVLRQRLLLELARRRMKENQDQINANAEILKKIG